MSDNRSSDERRRKLTARIAQEEQRISELNTELEQLCALVQELKNGTDKAQTPDNATSVATALGRGEKMRLFRTLFRGREDAWDLLLCRWAVKALAAMTRKTVAIRYAERIVDRGRLMGRSTRDRCSSLVGVDQGVISTIWPSGEPRRHLPRNLPRSR